MSCSIKNLRPSKRSAPKKEGKNEAIPLADVAWQSNNKKKLKHLSGCAAFDPNRGIEHSCVSVDDGIFCYFRFTPDTNRMLKHVSGWLSITCCQYGILIRSTKRTHYELRLRCVKIKLLIYSFNLISGVGNMVFQSFSRRFSSRCKMECFLVQRFRFISRNRTAAESLHRNSDQLAHVLMKFNATPPAMP